MSKYHEGVCKKCLLESITLNHEELCAGCIWMRDVDPWLTQQLNLPLRGSGTSVPNDASVQTDDAPE